jgi:hypothetical protein
MTRIGRYQIKSRQLCWQCILPARQSRPAQNFPNQTALLNISVPTSLGCLVGVADAVDTLTSPDPQAFLKSHHGVGRARAIIKETARRGTGGGGTGSVITPKP